MPYTRTCLIPRHIYVLLDQTQAVCSCASVYMPTDHAPHNVYVRLNKLFSQ